MLLATKPWSGSGQMSLSRSGDPSAGMRHALLMRRETSDPLHTSARSGPGHHEEILGNGPHQRSRHHDGDVH